MSKKNKKLNQMFLNFRQEAEKREISEFQNGGYKQNADDITRQAKSISQGISAGKNMTREIEQYTYQLNHFQNLIQKSGFDESWKSDANQFATTHHDSISTLTEANSARIQQQALREQRNKEQSESNWNKVGSTILSALAAMGGGENASNASQVRETSAAEKDIALEAEKRATDLQKQIDKNYEKYVALLDRKALKKSLHDGSLSGKDLKYAKEDYQAADEYKKAEMAAKALEKNKDIAKYIEQGGTANADSQAAKATTIVSVLLGNQVAAPLEFNKMLESAGSRDEKKRKISSLLTKRGYKTTEGITADDIAEYLVDRKTREINFDRAQQTAQEIARVSTDHPVLSTGLILATAPLKTIGTADTIAKTVEGWAKDEKVNMDANDPIYSFNNLYSNVVSTTAENLKNNYGDFASEAYRFGVNLADNGIRAAATMLLGGGKVVEAISLVSMGLGVMNDTAVELTNLGMDAKSAGTLSFIAGGAEVVTEMVPLDNLLGMLKNKSVLNKQQIIRGIVTQILTEGGEEGMSDVINDVADVVYEMVSVNPSRRQLEIEQLMKKEGLSYEEAYRQWTHNHTLDYIRDIAGGMLSGGIMAGGAMGTNAMINNTAAGANIMQYGRGNKSAVKAEIQGIIDSADKEGQTINKKQANVIRLNQQMNNGGLRTGNSVYDTLIYNGLNSTDESVRKQAQKLAVMRDQNGRQSLTGIGKLQNLTLRANTNVSIGVASQIMDEVGASKKVKEALVSAIRQEELSKKELKLLLNDENARNLISYLGNVTIDKTSSLSDIEKATSGLYGATFDIDNSTDAGKLYSTAARMRADGDIGFNGMKGFLSGYRDNLNMSLEEYTNVFKLAYNEAKAGKSPATIAEHVHSIFAVNEADEATTAARDAAVLRAALTAQNDIEHEKQQAEQEKKEAEPDEDATQKEDSALEEDTSEADSVTKEAVESAKKLSRLSESEKAEKFKNGGAIVESTKKLTTQQSAIISFYDFRGKKHGITYRFVNEIESNKGARGEYNHQTEVISIRIAEVADMTSTAGHELGHWLDAHYPEEYKQMQQYLKNTVFKTNYEAKVAAKIESYKKTGITIDETAAFKELTNDSLFGVDMASAEFEEFVKANETLMQKAFRVIRELLEDLQHFMEDWRKQLPEMYKHVTEIKMVQELYDDVEFMEYTADWVDRILNRSTASEQSGVAKNENEVAKNENKVAKNENKAAKNENKVGTTTVVTKSAKSESEFYNIVKELVDKREFEQSDSVAVFDFSVKSGIDKINSGIERNNKFYNEEIFNELQSTVTVGVSARELVKTYYEGNGFEECIDLISAVNAILQNPTQMTASKKFLEISSGDLSFTATVEDGGRYLNIERCTFYAHERAKSKVGIHYTSYVPNSQKNSTTDQSGVSYSLADFQTIKNKIKSAVKTVIDNRGNVSNKYNTIEISSVPSIIADYVYFASKEKINIYSKSFKVNAGLLYHEYKKHSTTDDIAMQQIPLTAQSIEEALTAFYSPDYVEAVLTSTKNRTQQQSFVYAKKNDGGYVVVVAVGGNRNRSVVPVEILHFDEQKWEEHLRSGKTFAEILYKNDKNMLDSIDVAEIKKNRVTVAAFTNMANSNPRSPRFNNIIRDNSEKSNSDLQIPDIAYMQAVESGNEQEQQRLVEQAAKERWGAYTGNDGKPIYFYHQTAEDFTVFDTSRPGAGKSDYETPSGIFIKPHNRDIGLKGKKQMPLFAFIKNPLVFKDRAAAARYYSQHVKGYADIVAEISSIDNRFSQMYNELDKALDEEYIKYRKARIEGRISKTEYKKRIDEAQKKEDVLFEKWGEASNRAGEQAKELITAYFEKSDFDAVIIEKDAGSFGRSTETFIVFDSSQVKSADPITYDDNGEIIPLSERFSESKDIRFQVADTVEETKDLVAVHNLSEENLMKSLELGGMPMPSIAVMRAKESGANQNYGSISLVFSKDTIDPEKSRDNKVYGGDVWSPVYPKIEYKINEKKADEIYSRARKALSGKAAAYNRSVLFDSSNIEDSLDRLGYEGTIEKYANDYNTKQFFLVEQGEEPEKTIQREKKTELSDSDVEMSEFFISRMKDELELEKTIIPREWYRRHGQRFDEVYTEYMKSLMPDITEKELQNVFNNMKPVDRTEMRKTIKQYYQNGKIKTEVIDDIAGTMKAIDSKIDERKYRAWLKDLFANIIEKKGIRNDVDIFDPIGNRRSFEALHYEENLENVVRAMKSKENGESVFFSTGIWAVAAKNYGTIKELKEDAQNRLKTIPDEEMSELKQSFEQRFTEIANALIKEKKTKNIFIALDCAYGNVLEAIKDKKTKSGVLNELRSYYGDNVTESLVDDILDLVADVGNMPTAYFEAKPQRGVSFNEVYTAVIPDNASAELKSALDKAGVKYQTYEAGNEEDRVRVINSLDEVKFQISDTTLTPEQQAAIERKATRREMAKLERENENLKAALDAALKQTKLSKDFRHDRSQTPKIARKLLKRLSVVDLSESEQKEFIAALDALFDRIDDANLEGTGGSDVIYMSALEAVEVIKDNIKYTEKYEELAGRAQEFADYFKGRTYISEAQAKELRYNFGGVDKANQLVHGLNFATAKGGETTLDMQWREIMETFPDFINEELTDTDEPLAIIKSMQDAREMIDGTLYSPFDEERLEERAEAEELGSVWAAEQEQMNDLAMKLIDSYTDAEWKATYADKAKGKEQVQLIRQRQELRRRMEKYRAQVNERNETYRKKIEKNYQERYNKAISRNDLRVQMEKERLANYKERVAENRKKATERKRQTEYKNKIKKIAFELGSMAANPNKKKHIPSGLVKTTHEFLSMIETGDMTQERLNHYVGAITQEFDSLENGVIYEALKSDYNAQIHDMLKEVVNRDESIRLKELSSEDLEKVYKIARVIKRAVSEMNLFHYVDKNRTVVEYQNALIEERKGKIKLKESTLQGAYRKFRDNELKPVYFFESLNSPTMNKLYQALRAGQAVVAQDTKEAEDVMLRLREKHGYSKWDLQKKYKFKLAHCNEAKEVELSLPQIMSLKALSEREAGLNHLLDGGFQIRHGTDARRTIKGKFKSRIDKTEYRITADELQTIINTLTQEQVAFVHDMRDYLAHELSKKGNEVSRKMWDIEIFGEDKYFPIHTSDDFNAKGDQKVIEGKMLKNWGSSKQLVPHAHNPLVLEEFSDAWAGHVEEMANYHAFTLPLEDFQKVYGYSNVLTADEEHQLQESNPDDNILQTVSIQNLFTNSQQAYIEKFVGDVNGSIIKSDETLSTRGISKYKKISTALNLRVTVQQPGAIARAFLYISPKYFAKTTGTGLKGIKSDSAAVQEMEKYSDAAFFKSLGFFDVGEGRSIKEYLNPESYEGKQKFTALAYDGDYRDSKMLAAPEMMDRITWLHIWNAAKAKVAAEEHLTGEALLKRTGEVFNDVVDKTQVYDSIFTRSGHMRSNNPFAKMATAFLAEPTTTINMLHNAWTQYRMGNAKKGFVAKAFAACFTATLLTNLLASVVSAMRHGQDDDNWWELWVGEFTSDFLTDIVMVNSIPLVRDLFNLAKGWDVERADMTLASNFIDAVKKLTKAQQNGTVTATEWYDFMAASAAMIGVPVLSLKKDIFGIFQAAKIMSNGTSPTYEGFKKALKTGWYDASAIDDILSLPQPSTNKYDMIYQLYAAGNTKEADKRKKILFKYDKDADQSKLDSYIEGQLLFNKDVIRAASALMKGDMSKTKSDMAKVKNFDKALVLKAMVKMLNEQVDEDAEVTETSLIKGSTKKTLEQNLLLNNPTVRKAAIALNKNDDEARYNLQKQLVSEGYSVNDVIKATSTVKGKMFPSEKKDESSTKEAKLFQYTDVADALKANNVSFAKKVMNRLIEDYKKEGKSTEDVKKQVRAKITSAFKEEYYMASESRRSAIRVLMWKTGAYDNGDAVLDVCNGWVKQIAKKKFGN